MTDQTQADRRIVPPHPPARAVRVFGLPRSGNHGIIKWLLRNSPCQQTLFLNNCTPFRDPFAAWSEVEIDGARWKSRVRAAGRAAEANAAITRPPLLLASYERWVPGMPGAANVSGEAAAVFDRDLLIHRSFLNWLASLVQLARRRSAAGASGWQDVPAAVAERADQYADMIRQAVASETARSPLQISYDGWFTDGDYRADLLSQLTFPLRDNGLGRVSSYGGGSSFEEGARNAASMDATGRHRQMWGDPLYDATVARMRGNGGFMDRLAALYPKDADAMTAQAA